ncbi:unnamed protein product, partial [Prorocentrum cordatum]
MPREMETPASSRRAAEARAAGAPLLIAPARADRAPQGAAAGGRSAWRAGVSPLRVHERLGRLKHARLSFPDEEDHASGAAAGGDFEDRLGASAPRAPWAGAAAPTGDDLIDPLRERQPEPNALDREALRALISEKDFHMAQQRGPVAKLTDELDEAEKEHRRLAQSFHASVEPPSNEPEAGLAVPLASILDGGFTKAGIQQLADTLFSKAVEGAEKIKKAHRGHVARPTKKRKDSAAAKRLARQRAELPLLRPLAEAKGPGGRQRASLLSRQGNPAANP